MHFGKKSPTRKIVRPSPVRPPLSPLCGFEMRKPERSERKGRNNCHRRRRRCRSRPSSSLASRVDRRFAAASRTLQSGRLAERDSSSTCGPRQEGNCRLPPPPPPSVKPVSHSPVARECRSRAALITLFPVNGVRVRIGLR